MHFHYNYTTREKVMEMFFLTLFKLFRRYKDKTFIEIRIARSTPPLPGSVVVKPGNEPEVDRVEQDSEPVGGEAGDGVAETHAVPGGSCQQREF